MGQSTAFRTEMIQDALQVHTGLDCCGTGQCSDAVKLAGLLGTPGDEAAVGREIVKPSFGNGNGHADRQAIANEATERQIGFLLKLAGERDFHSLVEKDRNLVRCIQQGGKTDKRSASALINILLGTAYSSAVSTNGFQKDCNARVQAADANRRSERVVLEAAIYLLDGVVYKVQQAIHGSGQMYAKKLVTDEFGPARFEYAAGAIRNLRPEHKMSLEQAVEFGAVYGVCCRCGRTLTDENSIEAGIGPVCASKF